MAKTIALCLERLEGEAGWPRFVRCVALGGRQPGLRLGAAGEVLWQPECPVAAELWVSADERLMYFRPAGAPPSALERSGRRLDVPQGKPVVVVDNDVVTLGDRRLRLHVHGAAGAVHPPEPLPERAAARPLMARAAAVAIGTAVAAGGCIEVIESPPSIIVEEPEQGQQIEVR